MKKIYIDIPRDNNKLKKLFNLEIYINKNEKKTIIIQKYNNKYQYKLNHWKYFMNIPNKKNLITFLNKIYEIQPIYIINISNKDIKKIFNRDYNENKLLQIRNIIDKRSLSYGNIFMDYEYKFDNDKWTLIDCLKDSNEKIWNFCNNKIKKKI